jgi:hypothetical protein
VAAERRPGSNRGRPLLDWEAAFGFYASLPDPERSYQAVADRYQVSVRTVERHGREKHWKGRLADIKRQAAANASEALTAQLTESLTRTLRMTEATLTRYAQQLQAGTVKVTPSDLVRLTTLQQQLADTLEAAHNRPQPSDLVSAADAEDPELRRRELVRALQDAGVFDRLRADLEGAR